ncbi:MAG: NAD(P)H-hydrate dehydratase [Dehalococcoidia bacterium]|nr:NAD(P)H-hydrate dehydratase [Dehalococcoidia bacterium]
MKIVTAAETKQLEVMAERNGITATSLMENSGVAIAQQTRRILGNLAGKKLLALIGTGNNGGDGLVAARYLRQWGADVALYLCAERKIDDDNLKLALDVGVLSVEASDDIEQARLLELLAVCDVAIDAVFGTGQKGYISGISQKVLSNLNRNRRANPAMKVVAVDLPSGLNADNGEADPNTPFADYTVTLGYPKRGLFTASGALHAGKVISVDIGLPAELAQSLLCESFTDDFARTLLPLRSPYAHKGVFGKVLVLAGSPDYIGAAYLCCGGALRVGSGLATIAGSKFVRSAVAGLLPEVTHFSLMEASTGDIYSKSYKVLLDKATEYDVFLAGCGLGLKEITKTLALKTIFRLPKEQKMVLDADVLNYLATLPNWWHRLPSDAVLTPHPGEMARLCGLTIDEVYADRFDLTLRKAKEWNKTIVLKGANSIIASPNGALRISCFANAGLASAGTGDVLAGVIAGLLAQGLSFFDAAYLGVYLHAKAGEAVCSRLGDTGMLASDLLPELPLVIKCLKEIS